MVVARGRERAGGDAAGDAVRAGVRLIGDLFFAAALRENGPPGRRGTALAAGLREAGGGGAGPELLSVDTNGACANQK